MNYEIPRVRSANCCICVLLYLDVIICGHMHLNSESVSPLPSTKALLRFEWCFMKFWIWSVYGNLFSHLLIYSTTLYSNIFSSCSLLVWSGYPLCL